MMSRLKRKYFEEVVPLLRKQSKKNVMSLPRLKKIVINMGIAEVTKDKGAIESHVKELMYLSGQKPLITRAKQAISNFKLRKGQPIGLKVTLRGKRMYDFFDRFCNIVSPRIRDFRGFRLKADGKGNVSIGLEDQQAFPEVNLDEVKRSQGMNITFVTSAAKDSEGIELLKLLGFPFKNE